ncbi:MAG: hypothetical protein J5733_06640 [Bacteroidaceae bacterium]|jgi:hypothetical protein|nr:hypothetical protein [Bacteroidaceae bacterium]
MDEIKNIQDLLSKWQEADGENRGFILITSERKEKGKDSDSYSETCGVVGSSEVLTAGVAGLIENGEAPLLKIINRAKAHLMFKKFVDTFCD